MNHLVVVGGFTDSKRSLERVADTAVSLEIAHDAEVVVLRKARKLAEKRLHGLMRGAKVLTHSAGVMTVPVGVRATDLAVVAPPEPTSVANLTQSAVKKTINHVGGYTKHRRADHLRVVAGNTAELALHPVENAKLVGPISHFSTIRHIIDMRNDGLAPSIGYFQMKEDEFFPLQGLGSLEVQGLDRRTVDAIASIPGHHDELLVDPHSVLSHVAWHMPGIKQ